MADARLNQASTWLAQLEHTPDFELLPLAGDASFRRYFRVLTHEQSYILMDAPPDKEDISPFIRICLWLEQSGLNVPTIIARNQGQGFLLLQDFGDVTWSVYHRQHHHIDNLFQDALRQLHMLQKAKSSLDLPLFDVPRMQRECDLYLDWYLPLIKKHMPNQAERQAFHAALLPLLEEIHQLPQAPVHLDYHSRNLMVPDDGLPLGVIDFQDAVLGPVTYDLASLLYDCYQDYPEHERRKWSKSFHAALPEKYSTCFTGFEAWHKALRLTALQRHIKVLGIFARLAYRDGKTQFLNEIPLTHKHFHDELNALSLKLPLLNA